MRVQILDEWFDTPTSPPISRRLDGHDVTVWTDHAEDADILAERPAKAEALVLFRKRTPIPGLGPISNITACNAGAVHT